MQIGSECMYEEKVIWFLIRRVAIHFNGNLKAFPSFGVAFMRLLLCGLSKVEIAIFDSGRGKLNNLRVQKIKQCSIGGLQEII